MKYLWFLSKEEVLFEGQGKYARIKVTKRGSRVNLFTGNKYLQTTINGKLTSRNTFFSWYMAAPWFSGKFDGVINSMLILGLGGGSQVKYYNQVYKVTKITGVEIDPLIIEVGQKYFDLTDANLKTEVADAYNYINTTHELYDLIIVDLFKENKSENDKQSIEFLNRMNSILTKDGVLFINKLNADPSNEKLERDMCATFKNVYTMQVFYTKFFIATNCEGAPKTLGELKKILVHGSKFDSALRFLKDNNCELGISTAHGSANHGISNSIN